MKRLARSSKNKIMLFPPPLIIQFNPHRQSQHVNQIKIMMIYTFETLVKLSLLWSLFANLVTLTFLELILPLHGLSILPQILVIHFYSSCSACRLHLQILNLLCNRCPFPTTLSNFSLLLEVGLPVVLVDVFF